MATDPLNLFKKHYSLARCKRQPSLDFYLDESSKYNGHSIDNVLKNFGLRNQKNLNNDESNEQVGYLVCLSPAQKSIEINKVNKEVLTGDMNYRLFQNNTNLGFSQSSTR